METLFSDSMPTRVILLQIVNILQIVCTFTRYFSYISVWKPGTNSLQRISTGPLPSANNAGGMSLRSPEPYIKDGNLPGHRDVAFTSDNDRQDVIHFKAGDGVDYTTLHNILYYIYTGYANLPCLNMLLDMDPLPKGYPAEADPFVLYRNAHKFLLPELKEYCLYELKGGITPENVTTRLFHPICQQHPDLKEIYFNYLVENYDAVKDTDGWERAIIGDQNESSTVRDYRMRLIFEITKKVRR
jgi:hypothetical protein